MKLQRFALALAGVGMLAANRRRVRSGRRTGQADPKPSWSTKAAQSKQQGDEGHAAAAEPCHRLGRLADRHATVEGVDITPASRRRRRRSTTRSTSSRTRASATWYSARTPRRPSSTTTACSCRAGTCTGTRRTCRRPGRRSRPSRGSGSGWTSFKSIATSNYSVAQPRHAYLYGLNTNGSLYRYAQISGGFRALGSFAGFRGFKAMTVISETATYDTLLMTTNAGALYTIRIPVTATAKPVVKLIRRTGWSAYESLVVQGCGTRGGSLVVGVDHDTESGYQYAMSKANGTATAITSYGKIPAVFNGIRPRVLHDALRPAGRRVTREFQPQLGTPQTAASPVVISGCGGGRWVLEHLRTC